MDNALLKPLYDFMNGNEENLQELLKMVQKSNVVPFVGAGMSYPVYPLWKEFFEEALKDRRIRPSVREEIRDLLRNSRYEKAASCLEGALKKAGYTSLIKGTFSDEKIDREILMDMPASILPEIFKEGVVITTNFDRLLNVSYEVAGHAFKDSITSYEDSKVAVGDFLQGFPHYLLKLHGDYLHTDRIVFTEEQYDECYGRNLESPYVSFIRDALSTRVLLFLGCGLDKDRTMDLLVKTAIDLHRTHYAVVECSTDDPDHLDNTFYDKYQRLSEMGIHCIWYPKDKHEYVRYILQELKRNTPTDAPGRPLEVVTATPVQKPSRNFLGRLDEIKNIKEKLMEDMPILISGAGGIGKTQICSSIYHDILKSNPGGLRQTGWITYNGSLKQSLFQQVASIKGTDDMEEYLARSIQYFDSLGRGLLLFIDNASGLPKEEQNLLASLQCRLVVSSRDKDFNESFKPVYIGRLPEEYCIELYIRTQGSEMNCNIWDGCLEPEHSPDAQEVKRDGMDREAVGEIVRKADRHTVTIVLLSKAQEASHISETELLEKIEKSGFNLQDIREEISYGDEDAVFIEHLAGIFKVIGLSCEEIRILKLFSLLPYIPLKYRTAKQWFLLEDYTVVNSLVKKAWLLDDGRGNLLMHPVISSVIRFKHRVNEEDCREEIWNIASSVSYTVYEDYTEKWMYAPFVFSTAEYFKEDCDISKGLAYLFSHVALVYKDQGIYDKALEYYQKALGFYEETLGEGHPDTATTYNNLAWVYKGQGEYGSAMEYLQKVIGIRKEVLGEGHPDTATAYNNLAGVYQDQGEYGFAMEYYHKALGIRKEALREGHPDIATTYNNLAVVYKAKGEYGSALEYHHKALEIYEKVLGESHPDTAATYNNLAVVYNAQGKYGFAMEYYQKALKIDTKAFGEGHPDTATIYNNLAGVYKNQGDYGSALEYYQKAFEIRKKVLREGHPDTATTYNNIAWVYNAQGKYDFALEYYQKALGIRKKALGEGHPDTASTYNGLAGVYHDQGDYGSALEHYQKALEIDEKALGEGHPDTATIYNNLALVYHDQGDYDSALEYYQKALEIDEKALGEGHPDTAATYNNLAVVYNAQGEYGSALEYHQKALEIDEKALGEGHPDTATTYNNLAMVYKAQGEYSSALEYHHKALKIVKKALGEYHPSTATIYNNLAVVYKAQGKHGSALEYYQKALRIRKKALGEGHLDTASL